VLTKRTARETPAPAPLFHGKEPARPPAKDGEPRLAVDQIQGNIFPGFKKDFRTLLFLKIVAPKHFKPWLASLVPFIATTEDVLAFNRLYKTLRVRRGDSLALQAVWINIAFSYNGLNVLAGKKLPFTDQAFKEGMAKRALDELGDPREKDNRGNPENWLVGGPNNEADLVLIVDGDDRNDVAAIVDRLETSIYTDTDVGGKAHHSGVQVIIKQHGALLPPPLTGHEHFGFLDGVSQPGVRGLVSNNAGDFLTPRQNPNDKNQGKPGQDLLWPGEFVFGYPAQDKDKAVEEPGAPAVAGPGLEDFAKNGSFLVFRRLRQDVGAFHDFLNQKSAALGLSPALFGAKLVGRWASGAPVLRTPDDKDDPDLGNNDCANNNFEFFKASPKPPDTVDGGTQCGKASLFPPSPGDPGGVILPPCGHIRKAYPRDDITPAGAGEKKPKDASDKSEQDTQTHRLLRRGIPYGAPSQSRPEVPLQDDADRGLLFLAYQTSIVRQFEFVTKLWVNNANFKDPGAGHDLIIGQNNKPGEKRVRKARLKFADGQEKEVTTADEKTGQGVDWVVPTGGGYFFAPSIATLRQLAGQT
jgi:Dyp-type peroxidase family